jgi:Protein of unknown function (DUF3617)
MQFRITSFVLITAGLLSGCDNAGFADVKPGQYDHSHKGLHASFEGATPEFEKNALNTIKGISETTSFCMNTGMANMPVKSILEMVTAGSNYDCTASDDFEAKDGKFKGGIACLPKNKDPDLNMGQSVTGTYSPEGFTWQIVSAETVKGLQGVKMNVLYEEKLVRTGDCK